MDMPVEVLERQTTRPAPAPSHASNGAVQQRDTPGAAQPRMWVDGEFTLFETALPQGVTLNHNQLLRANSYLPAYAKCCIAPDGTVRLRAEMPTDPEDCDQLTPGLAALQTAAQTLRTGKCVQPDTQADAPDLMEICKTIGWTCGELRPGEWRVNLETVSPPCHADVVCANNEVCLTAILTNWSALSEDCDAAMGLLLMRTSGALRLARAAILTDCADGQRHSAVLTARIPFTKVCVDLHHVLCALGVGVRRVLREAKALQTPDIARRYMANAYSTQQ